MSGPARYEAVLHNNLLVFVCGFVCAKDVCRGQSGLNLINGSLYCMWRDKRGMWRRYMQWCSARELSFLVQQHISQDLRGEARRAWIRGRDKDKEQISQQERGPHLDWQSTTVSGGEPAQDKTKNR